MTLDAQHRTLVEPDRVVRRLRNRLLDPQRVQRHVDAAVALAAEVERASG